jgi:aminoglycoside phosphotransferase (APT) family kinase protein
MENLVATICAREGLNAREYHPLRGGQVNQVFLIDGAYVLRIGARQDAFQRLTRETELLRRLADKIPVPKIFAFGQQDGFIYQIQHYLPGQNLQSIWKDLRPEEQEKLAAELAGHLKTLHSTPPASPGYAPQDGQRYGTWGDLIAARFHNTLEEIKTFQIQMVPGYIELALNYFEENKQVLADSVPAVIHGDLTMVNILVDQGSISAILDFEYSLQAPIDYELLAAGIRAEQLPGLAQG